MFERFVGRHEATDAYNTVDTGQEHQRCRPDGAEQIAEIDPQPIPDNLAGPNAADSPRHRNEVVPGKELRPTYHHQHKTQTERHAPGKTEQAERNRSSAAPGCHRNRVKQSPQ